MRDDQDEREQEQAERPRPKVVDRRISARASAPEAGSEPAPAGAPDATAEATVGTVPETPAGGAAPQEAEPEPARRGGPEQRVWTPEEEAEARRMAEEVARTPSLDWVVNAAATLANVAGTKLDLGAAGDAQLAIDALAGLVNSVGPRLEGAERPLRQLLADL
ncbi:MAG TPA: hypothetical protein VHN37_02995, partial [Actinomycetota bacterium]|nr:hypothetical protein [Actinomycetota bacterium]